MNDESMTCREFVELVGAHFDGALRANQAACFEAHLARCPKCRRYLASYKATVSLVQAAIKGGEEQAAESLPEDLVKSILRRHPPRK